MNLKIAITIIFVLGISWLGWRYLILPSLARIKFYFWVRTPHIKHCHRIIDNLFDYQQSVAASIEARRQLKTKDPMFTYGEITFFTFAETLAICKPQPGEVFYDLGSGSGKAVLSAALLYDFSKTCGIEKLASVYDLSQQHKQQLLQSALAKQYYPHKTFNINFIHDDMLNVNLSDANIIFVGATCFSGEFWEQLQTKLQAVKPGTRIIITTKRLSLDYFKLLDAHYRLLSWGYNSVYVYVKRCKLAVPLAKSVAPGEQ